MCVLQNEYEIVDFDISTLQNEHFLRFIRYYIFTQFKAFLYTIFGDKTSTS